jgi:hypothetical protein
MEFGEYLDLDRLMVRTNSAYCTHLNRYLSLFPRENLLVLLYEDFGRDTLGTVSHCYRFLGVDPEFVPPSLTRQVNRGRDASTLGKEFWDLYRRIKPRVTPAVGEFLSAIGQRLLQWLPKRKAYEPLSEQMRKELMHAFLPDIQQLEQLLERDLSLWYAPASADSGEELAPAAASQASAAPPVPGSQSES